MNGQRPFAALFWALVLTAATGCECSPEGGNPDGAAGPDGSVERDGAVSLTCGNGVEDDGERCDDANRDGGDGCSADCSEVEEDFVCIVPGQMCVRIVTCGNARIEGSETCDDRNTNAGDGCDADCQREEGWVCAVAGVACAAARCGDGLVAGFEECDDGGRCNGGEASACRRDEDCADMGDGDTCEARDEDGCDATCALEEGAFCPTPGEPCGESDCGNSVVEGLEECDDGNPLIGDGCTPFCLREPQCTGGVCTAVCGDEVVFAPETCDDGNTRDGDGCSSSCAVETGWECDEVELPDPDSVVLPVVVRDFIAACQDDDDEVDTRAQEGEPGASAPFGHPDFQCYNGAETGMVEPMLVGGVPARASSATRIESDASFALWYRSDDDFNRTVVQAMTFDGIGGGAYRFDTGHFYPLSSPIDGSAEAGFVEEGFESLATDTDNSTLQNFHFTSEVRFWFAYEGTETLEFAGDDDVWVFINRRLAVDIGGVHGREDGTITLADCDSGDASMNDEDCLAPLDLTVGGIYEAVVFQAERHTSRSQYRLTLSNFNRAPSQCRSMCGDGVVASNEQCDDGEMNGAEYGGCTEECSLTPFCGDGIIQAEYDEICDDGLNLGGGPSACAPGCQAIGAACGDGVVQVDQGETCDDGNTVSLDGCDMTCQVELM